MSKFWLFIEGSILICSVVAMAIVLSLLAGSAPDLAAWVQAVGSIAALAIAIFVMARQNKHATKLVADADRLATIRRAKSVQAVLRRSYLMLQQIERDMVSPPLPGETGDILHSRFRVAMALLKRLRITVDGIPAFDLGSFEMADALLQFADGLDIYEGLIDILMDEPDHVASDYIKSAMATHRPTMDDAIEKFNRGLAELQAAP